MADLIKKIDSIEVANTDTSKEAFEALKSEMLKDTINSESSEAHVDDTEEQADHEIEQVIDEEVEVNDEAIEEVESEESEVVEDTQSKKDKTLAPAEQDAVQKRINKLTAQRKAVDEENRLLRAQLESIKAPQQVDVPEIIGEDWFIRPDTREKITMPKAADYAGDAPLYFEHMNKFNNLKAQVVNAVEKFKQSETLKASEANLIKEEYLKEKLPGALERYKDFYEVVGTDAQNEFEAKHPWAVEALMESDVGTDIVYKLNKNPAYLRALIGMKPAAVLKEIGRLEAMEETKAKPRMVSSAPKPISPTLKTGGAGIGLSTKQKSFEELSTKELKERLRNRR